MLSKTISNMTLYFSYLWLNRCLHHIAWVLYCAQCYQLKGLWVVRGRRQKEQRENDIIESLCKIPCLRPEAPHIPQRRNNKCNQFLINLNASFDSFFSSNGCNQEVKSIQILKGEEEQSFMYQDKLFLPFRNYLTVHIVVIIITDTYFICRRSPALVKKDWNTGFFWNLIQLPLMANLLKKKDPAISRNGSENS